MLQFRVELKLVLQRAQYLNNELNWRNTDWGKDMEGNNSLLAK